MILRCCCFSSTASRPAHRARALLPVPARPPSETIPTSGSSSRSIASRCSALRPCRPNTSRSPRTSRNCALARSTRPRAEPRSEWMTRPVFTGRSWTAAARHRLGASYSWLICSPERSISASPVQPESTASSARYSSAARPIEAAFTRIGRSFETTVTVQPVVARGSARRRGCGSRCRRAAARSGSTLTCSSGSARPGAIRPSPTAIGKSRRSCCTRSSSRLRSACRAK